MPGSEIETVVAFGRLTCGRTKVGVVVDRTRGLVFVVAYDRFGAGSVTSPSWVVAPREVNLGAILIGQVACRKHCTRNGIQQGCSSLRIGQLGRIATGDVAGPDEHGITLARRTACHAGETE